jgi:hypothetical protein
MEFIDPLVRQSIRVEKPHLYQEGYAYFAVKNLTDIEFTMVKTARDRSELPVRIILPRRGTIILRAKQSQGQLMNYTYYLENVLTGVEQYYEYKIIVM